MESPERQRRAHGRAAGKWWLPGAGSGAVAQGTHPPWGGHIPGSPRGSSSFPLLTPGLWGLLSPGYIHGRGRLAVTELSILRHPAVCKPGLSEGTASSLVGKCSAGGAVRCPATRLKFQPCRPWTVPASTSVRISRCLLPSSKNGERRIVRED